MWSLVSLLSVNYVFSFRSSFCLPFGKADDTPSPALPGRRTLLWQAGQGFAVAYYGFTLDALDLEHPQLSLN
jgi:hypothetical protein